MAWAGLMVADCVLILSVREYHPRADVDLVLLLWVSITHKTKNKLTRMNAVVLWCSNTERDIQTVAVVNNSMWVTHSIARCCLRQ
jgi:hypothetical protein